MSPYAGPIRDEPLAVELHNTLYAADGHAHDGLSGHASVDAWLAALADRLPRTRTGSVSADSLVALRSATRDALGPVARGARPPRAAVDALNAASGLAPSFLTAHLTRGADVPEPRVDWGDASREAIVLAAFAHDAIALITGPHRIDLRACGAPGCVLLYVKTHPRQGWCSSACGNRARQARHYQRVRGRDRHR